MGFFSGLLHDAVSPLLDDLSKAATRLVRTLILYILAGLCCFAVLVCLTIALDIWIASLAGPLIAALSVAGLYALAAVLFIVIARAGGPARPVHKTPSQKTGDPALSAPAEAVHPETSAAIDQILAPLLDILRRNGFKREEIVLMTGALAAKRAGPVPLTGAAVIIGFIVGRFWNSLLDTAAKSAVIIPVLTALLAQFTPPPAKPEG